MIPNEIKEYLTKLIDNKYKDFKNYIDTELLEITKELNDLKVELNILKEGDKL